MRLFLGFSQNQNSQVLTNAQVISIAILSFLFYPPNDVLQCDTPISLLYLIILSNFRRTLVSPLRCGSERVLNQLTFLTLSHTLPKGYPDAYFRLMASEPSNCSLR